MRTALFCLLLVVTSCTGEPTQPVNVDTPPPPGGTLEGVYLSTDNLRLTNTGLYDVSFREQYATDLRVSGKTVWFRAVGEAYIYTFSGVNEGNAIKGTIRQDYYSSSQGVIENGTPRAYTFVRQL